MAAPSGTVWGSVYGNYAKLGFYITHSSGTTSVTTTVQVWYWSKYGTADSVNTFYYDNLASSGSATTSKGAVSINTSVNTGSGWSTSNQSLLATYTHTFNRTTSKQTRYIYAKLNTIETIEGQTVSGSTTYTVDPLPSYTITYNGNGGTVSPTSVTKYYNKNITLPSTATRTGYTFKGWATSSTGSVSYNPGATYSGNANATLYAVWQANTYTVSYNANGGSGAPAAQTKTHGTALTLSSTKPTRTNYTFKGWATSATGSVAYAAGGSYTANQAVTLYAVWELAYEKPTINITTVARCNSAGTLTDMGTYVKVAFSWTTYYNSTTVKIEWKEDKTSVTTWSNSAQTSGSKSGTVSTIVGNNAIDVEKNYVVRITVGDSNGSTVVTRNISSMSLPIDVLAGGTGVAIGKVAETADMFDVNYPANFRKPVYMPNATAIYMKDASGTDRNALHLNQSNSLNLGYGGYAASEGMTAIYGNSISFYSKTPPIAFNQPLKTSGGSVEIFGGTPYIDFHYGSSTADYTARIIENASGKLTVYNSISNASDRNLKKDIDDLPDDYLKVLKSLKPSQYRFINGDDYLNVGFIAQDVEDAFVEAGFVDIPIVSNDDGVYTLDYNGFIAMLVQGYQKQQEEIDDLKRRLSALESLQNEEVENNNTEE